MGNRPFKPAFEPGQVTRLADVETSSILAKRFDALARRTGPDRTSFKVEDLIALDPGFTAKWGVTLVTRLFDTMDIDGSKSVSRDGFIAAAYSLSCGTTLSRPQVLFNMFDVGHRGEITQADFTAVFAEVCKAGIEPPRLCATLAPLTGSSGAAAAATRCDAPDDATDEMIAALGEIAGNSLHSFYNNSATSRMTIDEFETLLKQNERLQELRGDISALLAPGLLG